MSESEQMNEKPESAVTEPAGLQTAQPETASEASSPDVSSAETAPEMLSETADAERVLAEVAATSAGRGRRKVREGMVVSDKMHKTAVVAVQDRAKHRLYGKVLNRTTKLKVHDGDNTAGVGDRVVVMETRPQSATKRWRLVTIVEKAK